MELSYLDNLPNLAAIGFPLNVAMMLFLHCLIGLIAAKVAYRKGAKLSGWLIWGMIGGTLSLIMALRKPARPV